MRIARIKNPLYKKFSQRELQTFRKCHPGEITGREHGITAGNPLQSAFTNFNISFPLGGTSFSSFNQIINRGSAVDPGELQDKGIRARCSKPAWWLR
jgi:hypothetical protein